MITSQVIIALKSSMSKMLKYSLKEENEKKDCHFVLLQKGNFDITLTLTYGANHTGNNQV